LGIETSWLLVVGGSLFTAILLLALTIVRLRYVQRSEHALREAREQAQSYLDAAGVFLVGIDLDGRVLLINRRGAEILGRAEDEVLYRDWFETFVPQDVRVAARAGFAEFVAHAVECGHPLSPTEYPIVDASGGRHLMSWNRSVVRGADGLIASVLSSGEDVTERRHIERQLQFESYLLDSVSDSIIIHEPGGRLLYVNSAAAEMRGMTREELMARDFSSLVAEEYRGLTDQYRDALAEGDAVTFETGHVAADGSTMVLEVHAALVEYEGHGAVASVGRDITARRRDEARIREMAFHDPLTGLANRMLFNDRIELALRQARRRKTAVAILFMDFDHFKKTNDTYGHLAGDRLLALAGNRISDRVRSSDTVARFGGDEFAVVLPDVESLADARAVAESILKVLELPFDLEGASVRMPASIGVAYSPDGAISATEITRLADAAMYAAKNEGRGRMVAHSASGASG